MQPSPRVGRSALRAGAVVMAVAAVAWVAGQVVTLLGPAAVALVLGALVRIAAPLPAAVTRDFARIGTRLLQVSIVILGGSVGLAQVLTVAGASLPVMLATVFGGLTLIWLVGGRLNVPITTRGLLAVGTSICGASAIAAAAPALEATSADVGYAVSVVFLFNFVAVVVFPLIAHAAEMSPTAFGVWAGTAVNDTSSVLAASAAFGSATVASATVVKLSRTLMILPATLIIALLAHQAAHDAAARPPVGALVRRAVPWFAVCFVLASLADSVGLVPDALGRAFGAFAALGVVAALAAVGLASDASAIRRAGPRPLILAGAGWIGIAFMSLLMQRVVGLV
jgi:uncharacterized integral membrane protein (TIGR00698 family)